MRKISLILIAAMLFSIGNVFANDPSLVSNTNVDPEKKLTLQIGELMKENSFANEGYDLLAQVRFTLNNESEIVVLSVATQDEPLESFVKSRLNYEKVSVNGFEEGQIYVVQVRIK
ncbi:MAG: response regulator RpfG family c-di-GMP phosphodiesterase [Sediminicola sp.]|jgi:response regulator RpfG family c-di-GMP phosphodiesterase